MNQSYFIVVLAHSLHGRIRRFHIDHRFALVVLALALVGCFSLLGFVSSYVRMAWKVANYNSLREETNFLRARYQKLLHESNQTTAQMARLQMFASEVSVAYGINSTPTVDGSALASGETPALVPSLSETLEQYNMLKTARLGMHNRLFARRWLVNTRPSLWPVMGRLLSYFGYRSDPFSGAQSFHTGVDISASMGTPVHVAGDGIVMNAEWEGDYGRLVVVDHGDGVQTYYAHLSRIDVIPGQEVRRGQVVGASGMSGRATAPHVHYEVRIGGTARNPYPYLANSPVMAAANPQRDFGF